MTTKTVPCASDPETWFNPSETAVAAAKAGCGTCPVKAREECLMVGLKADREVMESGVPMGYGVFAGLTPEERGKLRRSKGLASLGLKREPRREPCLEWNDTQLQTMTEMLAKGSTYQQVADHFGVTRTACRLRFKRLREQGSV